MSIRLTAKDRDESVHELEAEAGDTVMETMRNAGLPVEAVCGGCCSCATCHVFVDAAWRDTAGPRGPEEEQLLEISEYFDAEASRLGCQIALTEAHDGMVVTLAPEE